MPKTKAIRGQRYKLTVFIDHEVKKNIYHEKAETSLSIETIIHRRLTRSFEEVPLLDRASH